MRLIRDGYVGIAPVPGGRVNVGIVLGSSVARRRSRATGRGRSPTGLVAAIPPADDDPAAWRTAPPIDAVAGAWPLGHRVTRRAGPGWLLVGDAAGFLDPFTGEGLHRALVSAELAAAAIHAPARRSAPARSTPTTARCGAGSAPRTPCRGSSRRSSPGPTLFEYAARRVAARPTVRATMGLVMGDLVPAGRALDPRFLAALLAP